MTASVVTERIRKTYGPGRGTLYTVSCRTCPNRPVLCSTWERYEARLVARQHARGHRGRGR